MSRITWVRHGPTHAKSMVGWSDLPADLSDRAQIGRLQALLPEEALVVSSDLSRAVATADAIAGNRIRLPHDANLREIHFGAWELETLDTKVEPDRLRRFWEEPGDLSAPGGESWNDIHARVTGATEQLITTHPGREIIIVAHFGAILTQVQRALGLTAYEAFAHKIDNLSVTTLRHEAGQWHAERINQLP
ncbi:MAG: histidine phosphatase family protein [Roseovarius sp.]